MGRAQQIQADLREWMMRFRPDRSNSGLSGNFNAAGKRQAGCTDHPGLLTLAFNATVHPVCHACQTRAAIALEQRTGLEGIAGYYTLPPGLKAHDLENYALIVRDMSYAGSMKMEEGFERLHGVWQELCQRNPELCTINPNRTDLMQVFHAIMGVTSGYNPADIREFIHIGGGNVRRAEPEFRARLEQVETAIGHIGWIPASATLDAILSQLKNARPPLSPRRFGL